MELWRCYKCSRRGFWPTLNSLFFTLRLSGGEAAPFPRPLKAEEERMYLGADGAGLFGGPDTPHEHNLRLVAHIMKKYYTPTGIQDDPISIGTIRTHQGDSSTFKRTRTCAWPPTSSRCIENESGCTSRAQRKLQGEVSPSDSIDGDGDGNSRRDGHHQRTRIRPEELDARDPAQRCAVC